MADSKHTVEELRMLQALPLPIKIRKTQQRIKEFYEHFGGAVFVSYSGGIDSTVLLHLAKSVYPDIKAVYNDTGLELPDTKKFAKDHADVITRPKVPFVDVIKKYGYPVISKEVTKSVNTARRIPEGKVAQNMFIGNGKKHDVAKYKPLIDAPFLVANKCCEISKEAPLKKYAKESQEYPIMGLLADESQRREEAWLKTGCNAFGDNTKTINSKPMSFWTRQDELRYILDNNIEISPDYGVIGYADDPIQVPLCDRGCKLCTSECKRTGCAYCGFGAHMERKGESRFQYLKRKYPKHYDFCIGGGEFDSETGLWVPNKNGLGMGFVFDWLNSVYGENFIRYREGQ